jgi:hypothetical protein
VLAEPAATHPNARGVYPRLDPALERVDSAAGWQQQYLEDVKRQTGLERLKIQRTSTQGLFLEVPVNSPVPGKWARHGRLQKVEWYSTPALELHAIELVGPKR